MDAAGTQATATESSEITLVIKNPSKPGMQDFIVTVPASTTVLAVKERLAEDYDGKPLPCRQTLIYGGRVLREEEAYLKTVLRSNEDLSSTHTLHLVIKAEESRTAAIPVATPGMTQPASTSTVQSAASSSRQRTSAPVPAGSQGFQPTHPILQAGYAAGGWPTSQPDPTMLAAYNAALESLRSRPPFPSAAASSSANGVHSNGPLMYPGAHALGFHGQPGLMPPFSLAPTVLPPPSMPHTNGRQAGRQLPTGQDGAGAPPCAAASNSAAPVNGAQAATQQGQQGMRVPQLYAPALTYVPVNLVQQHPQSSQPQSSNTPSAPQAQPQQFAAQQPASPHPPNGQPQQQQLFPYPPFAPMVPMMMPFGFNPYAPPMFPGNQYPGGPAYHQQDNHQPNAPQVFQGILPPPAAPAPPQQQVLRPGQPPQVRVRMVRVNVKLIIQLCFLGLVIYQNTSHGRFFKILGGALALYFLWPIVNRDNVVRQRIQRMMQPRNAAPGDAGVGGGNAAPQPGQPAAAQRQGQPPAARPAPQPAAGPQPRGILQEVQALVVGFFTSLLPGFDMNAEDAAAFAAAQQVVAREERALQQQAAREHMD